MKLKLLVFATIITAGFGLWGWFAYLRFEDTRLRHRIADLRRQQQRATQVAGENDRLRGLIARTEADETDGARAIHAELVRARAEVKSLENAAEEKRARLVAQVARDTEALEHNRDPLRGPVRFEYLEDAGQATPAAAFQTLGWATLKKPERVPSLFALSPEARVKAEALLARLPESARAQWTPERLGELFLTGVLSGASAVHITNVTMSGTDRATLTVLVPGVRGEPKLTMALGSDGWRAMVDERGIDVVRKQLDQVGERK